MAVLAQLLVNALVAGAITALIASGLSFIYATTRVSHLAHGFVVASGGYVFWWLWMAHAWQPVLAAIVACVVASLLGLVMNEIVYELLRMRKTKGLGYLVATIGLLMFGNASILALFGSQPHSLQVQTIVREVGSVRVTDLQIFIVVFSVLLFVFLGWIIQRTKLGKSMRATADNEMVAEILGMKTRQVRRLTFLLGSFLAGIAGILVALEFNVEPNMGVMLAIKGFTAMVIGGAGSMGGAIVGSLVLGGVEQAAVWFWGAGWKNAMAFVLLFVFLLVRPMGIFGRKRFF
jgi:branched-chain amino acid transport system permease protein